MAEREREVDRFANATPRPWHVYEGGNFIRIGADGYDEFIERRHYLGGPLCVGETNYNATDSYERDHDKALANAELIVAAVNAYSTSDAEQLHELRRLAGKLIEASQFALSTPGFIRGREELHKHSEALRTVLNPKPGFEVNSNAD